MALIIYKHFNICCFRALAYTTLDRLSAVFLYNTRDNTNYMYIRCHTGVKIGCEQVVYVQQLVCCIFSKCP